MRLTVKSATVAGVSLLAAASLWGCKGRTSENMEPSGDTVEVYISATSDSATQSPSKEIPADSIL